MKCTKLLSKPRTGFWGMMKCTRLADLVRILSMSKSINFVSIEIHVDITVLFVRAVCMFGCLICMKVLMLLFIKLGFISRDFKVVGCQSNLYVNSGI